MICDRDFRHLVFFGIALLASIAALAWLSGFFAFGSDVRDRPIIQFVVLMTAIFVIHLLAF